MTDCFCTGPAGAVVLTLILREFFSIPFTGKANDCFMEMSIAKCVPALKSAATTKVKVSSTAFQSARVSNAELSVSKSIISV